MVYPPVLTVQQEGDHVPVFALAGRQSHYSTDNLSVPFFKGHVSSNVSPYVCRAEINAIQNIKESVKSLLLLETTSVALNGEESL